MKEHAKLYKSQRQRTSFTLSKRLQPEEEKREESLSELAGAEKRKKLGDGSAMAISTSSMNMSQSQMKPK